jgi:hypothetical protein
LEDCEDRVLTAERSALAGFDILTKYLFQGFGN